MVDKLDLDRLRALVEAASPLPWVYRPEKYDDWGWIRGVERDDRDIGPFRPIVANAKDSLVREEDMDAHRRAGTDPYGPNAELIVAAVNLIPTLLATPENGEQVERVAAAEQAFVRFNRGDENDGPPGLYERAAVAAILSALPTPTEDARERVKVLEEALDWALAEISGATRYTDDQQRQNCLAIAYDALGNKDTDRHG